MMQIIKRLFCLILALTLVLIVAIFVLNIRFRGEIKDELISPDGFARAVLTIDNPHSTASFTYRLYLLEKTKENPYFMTPVLKASKVEDLNIRWASSSTLQVIYKSAQIYEFSNFRYFSDGADEPKEIQVELIKENTNL